MDYSKLDINQKADRLGMLRTLIDIDGRDSKLPSLSEEDKQEILNEIKILEDELKDVLDAERIKGSNLGNHARMQ